MRSNPISSYPKGDFFREGVSDNPPERGAVDSYGVSPPNKPVLLASLAIPKLFAPVPAVAVDVDKNGRLTKDQVVQGVPLKSGTFLKFSESGYLEAIRPPAALSLQGVLLVSTEGGFEIVGGSYSGEEEEEIRFAESETEPSSGKTIYRILEGGIGFYKNGNVRYGRLAEDTVINGISFQKETKISFHSDRQVKKGVLAADTTIDGVSLKKGTEIEFDENGSLSNAFLSQETVVQGITLPKSAYVHFSKGRMKSVKVPWRGASIQGISLPGMASVGFSGSDIDFADLEESGEVQGIYFGGGTVLFFNQGKLNAAMVDGSAVIKGISLPKDSRVSFDGDRMASVTLGEDAVIQKTPLRKGMTVFFDQNGKIKKITKEILEGEGLGSSHEVKLDRQGNVTAVLLDEPLTILGVDFPAHTAVLFDGSRNLKGAILHADGELQGMELKKSSQVFFRHNAIVRILLPEETEINGISFKKGTDVWFHNNGQIESGTLSEETTIQGKHFRAGAVVKFGFDGRLQKK